MFFGNILLLLARKTLFQTTDHQIDICYPEVQKDNKMIYLKTTEPCEAPTKMSGTSRALACKKADQSG